MVAGRVWGKEPGSGTDRRAGCGHLLEGVGRAMAGQVRAGAAKPNQDARPPTSLVLPRALRGRAAALNL